MAGPILDNDLWAPIEAASAQTSTHTTSRAQATRQSRVANGHPIHSPDGAALGPATTRNGLWQRYELLRDWQAPGGVWDELHEVLLARLRAADKIDRGSSSTPRKRPAKAPCAEQLV